MLCATTENIPSTCALQLIVTTLNSSILSPVTEWFMRLPQVLLINYWKYCTLKRNYYGQRIGVKLFKN
jgi:hypothetical protein